MYKPGYTLHASAKRGSSVCLVALRMGNECSHTFSDCSSVNFMMDPSGLFPVPFHPVLTDMTRDIRTKVRPLTRSECPVKYYWIDFGVACKYRPEDRPPTERIVMGADKSPPEHKNKKTKCDPFPTDVYYVGNLVRESFLRVSHS
jgi:hypothetical protein